MKKPNNWRLVEMYEGNYIFEDINEEFQVSLDKMGRLSPSYHIHFNQLKGENCQIGYKEGAYNSSASEKNTALQKAYEMMDFINKHKK
ncbi:hypothetical protein [Salegentibacter salarius]|uniref:DRBM domain-containing protein n=1 Tax=Salegentibacter salarius TaxID=435906 RepID=A0A2N0TRL0_9FLAO|nr:hypothetical protein [Salegentibacter salarius]OEY71962.1 hypothetical protein BHS39_14690 [Salegentibacter salarius]PKD17318.1 hypothetical protein APR40_14660 [Salegentibacter salarius]SLK05585.1 hypothetical protein SAMN05660445_03021 [Salegentibacter salarius]